MFSTHLPLLQPVFRIQRHSVYVKSGNPYDNAVMESFWGRFKDTLRIHFRYWQRDDFSVVVADASHYFNFLRPIASLTENRQSRLEHGWQLDGSFLSAFS